MKDLGAGRLGLVARADRDQPLRAARVERYQRRPPEELYDLERDLAELEAWMERLGDRGLPEETEP